MSTIEDQRAAFARAPKPSEFPIEPFAGFDNEVAILNELGIHVRSGTDLVANQERLNTLNTYHGMRSTILPSLQENIIYDTIQYMDLEAQGEDDVPVPTSPEDRIKQMRLDGEVF